ncbi:P-loop containing nucleoside triphosphate hydrolase protein, partial [Macrolepiota fuliginosa MF-IS2]
SVPPSRAPSPPNGNKHRPSRRASIAIIGMPGVGKTTLASIAAKALGWEMLDTDAMFELQHRQSIPEFTVNRGCEATRIAEAAILADVLQNNPTEKVIACGARIIELEENRALLRKFREHGLVIHVIRDAEAVAAYL